MRKVGITSMILMLVCLAALRLGSALVLPEPFLRLAAVLCVASICTAVIASPGRNILREGRPDAGKDSD